MPYYCVNARAQAVSGDHEVHEEGCTGLMMRM